MPTQQMFCREMLLRPRHVFCDPDCLTNPYYCTTVVKLEQNASSKHTLESESVQYSALVLIHSSLHPVMASNVCTVSQKAQNTTTMKLATCILWSRTTSDTELR